MKLRSYINPDDQVQQSLCRRPAENPIELRKAVEQIFHAVKSGGDNALKDLTSKYDQVEVAELRVSDAEIKSAEYELSVDLRRAIEVAVANIQRFHAAQLESKVYIETSPGVTCWRESRGIERVGLYIPGGSAPLFSTVLMLGIPARIAGCKEIILCTPPNKKGQVHPAILYAASISGIHKIFKVGGAQAVAAMTIGTESISPVDKIFGPGNQYVTAAKLLAQEYNIAIDMPAGPSEVLVYADKNANVEFIAADLLSQAEHGPDSQVVLVADDDLDFDAIAHALAQMTAVLPRRQIIEKALENAYIVKFNAQEDSLGFINRYAPEHLIIARKNPEKYIPYIQNAGSVFLGYWTPESAGDYASGTNHTLPTAGFARSYSGVSVDSFVKKITFQKISQQGIQELGPVIESMARAEQLDAHALAVSVRINEGK